MFERHSGWQPVASGVAARASPYHSGASARGWRRGQRDPRWLGHVSLDTTNRYAEINIRSKEAALQACAPPTTTSAAFPRRPVWRNDTALLDWLASL
jgi:hypothetical protein